MWRDQPLSQKWAVTPVWSQAQIPSVRPKPWGAPCKVRASSSRWGMLCTNHNQMKGTKPTTVRKTKGALTHKQTSLFHTWPLLLYVRNGSSTLYAETMCAERSHQALISECFDLFLVTTQLVGNSPAWPCALLLALEEFSCITELTVSHCANNSKEGVHCRGPVHWAGPMVSHVYPHQSYELFTWR